MSQNPESSTMEAPPGPTITFTPELLQEYAAHPEKANALNRADRKAMIRAATAQDQGADPQNAPAAAIAEVPVVPKVEPKIEEKQEQVIEKLPEPTQSDAEIKEAKRRHQQAADEANKWEQKKLALAAKAERDRLEVERIKNSQVAPPDDFLDDKHQASLHERLLKQEKMLEQLQKSNGERDESELKDLQQRAQTNRETSVFSEIDGLQAEFPELKMSVPFSVANEQYSKWLEGAKTAMGHTGGVSKEQVSQWASKYDADPEFRNRFPVGKPQDLNKLLDILEIHYQKPQGGSLTAVYLDRLHKSGKLSERFGRNTTDADQAAASANAQRDAARKTVEAMKKKESELATLSPGDGSGTNPLNDEITPQTAAMLLDAMQAQIKAGKKLTPEQKAQSKLIREKLGKRED